MEFISTMEGREYPIYGVQWHPGRSIHTVFNDTLVGLYIHHLWCSVTPGRSVHTPSMVLSDTLVGLYIHHLWCSVTPW